MSVIKKFIVYTVLVAMSIGVVGCAAENERTSISSNITEGEVIARVNGQAIYQSDYDELYQEYYRYFGETKEAAEYLKSQKTLLLEELVNTEVLMQKAEKLGITCTDEEAENALKDIKEQYGEEIFNQMLSYSELTEEAYLAQIKKQLVLMELQEGMIADDIEVTDEEVATYYEKNQDNYVQGAGAEMRHILVHIEDEEDQEVVARAESAKKEIQAALDKGTSFEALYEKYAEEESDLYIVEDLGFIEYDQANLDQDLLGGAKALAEGEVSGPIKSSFGYHFIKVKNISDEKVISLEEAKDEIIEMLEEEKQYVLYQEQLERWVLESEIETYEDKIQS